MRPGPPARAGRPGRGGRARGRARRAAAAPGRGALPDAGPAAGTSVTGTVTASTTATGFGVVTGDPSCGAAAAGAVTASDAEMPSEQGLGGDFATPDFCALEFAFDGCTASALALASEFCLTAVSRSPEAPLA